MAPKRKYVKKNKSNISNVAQSKNVIKININTEKGKKKRVAKKPSTSVKKSSLPSSGNYPQLYNAVRPLQIPYQLNLHNRIDPSPLVDDFTTRNLLKLISEQQNILSPKTIENKAPISLLKAPTESQSIFTTPLRLPQPEIELFEESEDEIKGSQIFPYIPPPEPKEQPPLLAIEARKKRGYKKGDLTYYRHKDGTLKNKAGKIISRPRKDAVIINYGEDYDTEGNIEDIN